MPLGAFYGSLAAAASVIVGLLSAFLVNSLVGTRQDRRQLNRELQQTKDELRVRYAERDEYPRLGNSSLRSLTGQRAVDSEIERRFPVQS